MNVTAEMKIKQKFVSFNRCCNKYSALDICFRHTVTKIRTDSEHYRYSERLKLINSAIGKFPNFAARIHNYCLTSQPINPDVIDEFRSVRVSRK